jgi:methylated-DNA-[protein]-cysteine S-methyltransferase
MKGLFPILNCFLEVEWEDNRILKSSFVSSLPDAKAYASVYDETGEVIRNIIKEYELTGKIDLKGLELSFEGISPFYLKVYSELLKIPAGRTVTYGELAQRCGNRKAARAVGTALARNRLVLFVPCHRVVSANGMGGWSSIPGLKEMLLELEKKAGNL